MIIRLVILVFGLPLLFCLSSLHSAFALDSSFSSDITKFVNEPRKVYTLDLRGNERVFKRTERWVQKYIDLQKASCRVLDHKESVQCKLSVSENIPIPYSDADIDGLTSSKPFNIYYDKTSRSRSFHKALWVPTNKTQDKTYIAGLGEEFIRSNQFISVTDNDDILDSFVLSWKSRIIEDISGAGDTYTILYRVKYFRKFHELEVINSRQIVDFHPASLEIISYKSIMWTPVDEASGEYVPYLSLEEVIAQVDSFFMDETEGYTISNIQLAWYQSDHQIFPVLVILTQRDEKSGQLYPLEETLLVSLVKDMKIEDEEITNPLREKMEAEQ